MDHESPTFNIWKILEIVRSYCVTHLIDLDTNVPKIKFQNENDRLCRLFS